MMILLKNKLNLKEQKKGGNFIDQRISDPLPPSGPSYIFTKKGYI